jgi:hypothetical protein
MWEKLTSDKDFCVGDELAYHPQYLKTTPATDFDNIWFVDSIVGGVIRGHDKAGHYMYNTAKLGWLGGKNYQDFWRKIRTEDKLIKAYLLENREIPQGALQKR